MGGRGVQIIACFQSRAQLMSRWGTAGAAEIINNAGAIVLFGGINDRDDLVYWSTRCGMRDEEVLTTDQQGQITGRSQRQVPVLSPAQLANLPRFKVVVIRRYMAPVIGRAAMVWERRDVRAHTRAERAVVVAAERATRPAWGASMRQRVIKARGIRQINASRRRARGRL
jgi:type IV secretory pathway TraG/TraD family ATPase VirD4